MTRSDWKPRMMARASLEAQQVFCLTNDEGHIWIRSYDGLPPPVRRQLAQSAFNICPACLTIAVRNKARKRGHRWRAPVEFYLTEIEAIEHQLRGEV